MSEIVIDLNHLKTVLVDGANDGLAANVSPWFAENHTHLDVRSKMCNGKESVNAILQAVSFSTVANDVTFVNFHQP